jgi:hypothetical protein
MGKRSVLLGLSLLGLLVGVLGFRSFSAPAPESRYVEALEACEDYRCVRRALRNALDDLGPKGALTAYAATDPTSGFGIDCHGAAHELGEWAWRDYGRDAWFSFPELVCNYGYYHGAMVEIARTMGLEEFTALARELCEVDPLPASVLPGRECAHGFGHAVYYLTFSIKESVTRCNAFEGERFRRRCNEGIAKDILREEKVVDTEDFDKCGAWPSADRGVCAYITGAYAVVHADEKDLGQVSRFCVGLTTSEESGECFAGLGRGIAMRSVGEDFREPGRWAALICGDSVLCANDFGRSVFYVRDDLEWATGECRRLPDALQPHCREGVEFASVDRS